MEGNGASQRSAIRILLLTGCLQVPQNYLNISYLNSLQKLKKTCRLTGAAL